MIFAGIYHLQEITAIKRNLGWYLNWTEVARFIILLKYIRKVVEHLHAQMLDCFGGQGPTNAGFKTTVKHGMEHHGQKYRNKRRNWYCVDWTC